MSDDTHKAVSLAAWKKAADHYPLLPSGVRVGIKIPDLPALIEAGEIPQHLLDTAVAAANGSAVQADDPKKNAAATREFTDRVVILTVVEPKLDEESVKSVPYEDKDMIVQLATRQRDLDAEGEHIAGLTKSEKFRQFRELGEFRPDVEGL